MLVIQVSRATFVGTQRGALLVTVGLHGNSSFPLGVHCHLSGGRVRSAFFLLPACLLLALQQEMPCYCWAVLKSSLSTWLPLTPPQHERVPHYCTVGCQSGLPLWSPLMLWSGASLSPSRGESPSWPSLTLPWAHYGLMRVEVPASHLAFPWLCWNGATDFSVVVGCSRAVNF